MAIDLKALLPKSGRRTGEYPPPLSREAVFKKACKLVEKPTRTIKSIAADIGYLSASSFSGAFRKLTGHTPTEWRKMSPKARRAALES